MLILDNFPQVKRVALQSLPCLRHQSPRHGKKGEYRRTNIRGEIGRIVRRLTGTLEEPSAEERFVDVEQGIVIRENGKIRLKTKVAGG